VLSAPFRQFNGHGAIRKHMPSIQVLSSPERELGTGEKTTTGSKCK